jgi:hypothetical protein
MSAITSEWAPAETEAPTARAGKRSREEEFSAALERYIANYQRHRAATDRSEASHAGAARPSFFRLLVGWPR